MVEKTKIKILLITVSILVIIFIPFIYHKFHYQATHCIIKDAYVSTDIVNVGPQSVSGRIKKLYTIETDSVKKGMLLALIEDTNYKNEMDLRRIQVDIAQVNCEKIKVMHKRVEKTVEEMIEISRYNLLSTQKLAKQAEESYKLQKSRVEQNIQKARDELKIATSNLKRAKEENERYSSLFKQHAVSQLQFKATTHKYDVAKAQVNIKKAHLNTALTYKKNVRYAYRNLQGAKENLRKSLLSYQFSLTERDKIVELKKEEDGALKKVEEAKKKWELSQQKLAQTRITSPMSGIVAKKFLNEGDFVSPGTPIYAIYDPNNVFVVANLKSTKLKYAKPGKTVNIKVGGYKRKFNGKIAKISNIATAENASKVKNSARKLPTKVEILNDDKHLLKPGIPVIIVIKRSVK